MRPSVLFALGTAAGLLIAGRMAPAQEASVAGPLAAETDSHSAAAPAAAGNPAALGPICTDRPTKSAYACTVEAGHFQYEADLLNVSSLEVAGTATDTWLVPNPTFKFGIGAHADVELNIAPLEMVRSRAASGVWHTAAGFGDLYLRIKLGWPAAAGADLQAALVPYVKLPTATAGLGDGALEGGFTLPVNYQLGTRVTLTATPQLDILADAAGGGRHPNTAQTLNLAVALPKDWVVYAELWGDWDFDPRGRRRQSSADLAVTYGVTALLQLDAGLNLGLNSGTPGVQAYLGVSQKF